MSLKVPVSSDDHIQGDAKAEIVLVEYGDYECPHCGHAHPIVKRVQKHFGKRVAFVFRNFPLNEIHPDAEDAAESAEFAAAKGQFWEMHDAIFENQKSLGVPLLLNLTETLGLSPQDLERLGGRQGVYTPRVKNDFLSGVRSGVNGTPTFFINGQRHNGSFEFDDLVEAIESEPDLRADERATRAQFRTRPVSAADLRRKLWTANVSLDHQGIYQRCRVGVVDDVAVDVAADGLARASRVQRAILPFGASWREPLGDILNKRKLLLVTQIAMMLLSAMLGVLTLLGHISPVSLLLILFTVEVFDALAGPAWQTLIPEIVGPKDMRAAIALNSVGMNVARALGPAMGGALVAITRTSGPAFLINSASFLGVIVFLWRWKRRADSSGLPAERFVGAMRIGVRYVRYSPRFRATLLRIGAYILFGNALATLLPIIARTTLHRGPAAYGVLLGFMGAGAVAAVPVLQHARRLAKLDVMLAIATAISGGVEVALGTFHSFPLLCGIMLIAGVAWVTVMSSMNNAAQSVLPAWVRARAMAVYLMVFFGAMSAGGIVWGLIANRYGAPMAMTIAACGMFATLALIPRFRLIEYEKLDLSPSLHWPAPMVGRAMEDDRGPVLITVEYRIDSKRAEEFTRAMQRVRLGRMRTGAFQWGLFNDTADPTRFVETFLSDSWAEHLRQHARDDGRSRDRGFRRGVPTRPGKADCQAFDSCRYEIGACADKKTLNGEIGFFRESRRGRGERRGYYSNEISRFTAAIIVCKSSIPIANGGIRTITSPSGRMMMPCLRHAWHTAAPTLWRGSNGAFVALSATSSIPTIKPFWRISPTWGKSFSGSRSFASAAALFTTSAINPRCSNKSSDASAAAAARGLPV